MKRPRLTKPSETALVASCLAVLAARGIYAWRNNSGAFRAVSGGRERFHRFGKVGSSDILGLLPGGRFMAIECKRPGNGLSDAQLAFSQAIRDNGGCFGCVFSVEQLEQYLATWRCG